MAKKAYRTEASLPPKFRADSGQSKNYSNVKNPPNQVSTQHLDKQTDLERLVNNGIKNPAWFKRLLSNVGMTKILDYAEERIKNTRKLNEDEKNELLETIASHPLRQKKELN